MWREIFQGSNLILARGHFSLCHAMWEPRVGCDVALTQPGARADAETQRSIYAGLGLEIK